MAPTSGSGKPPPSIHLLGGAICGLSTCIVLQPFDVVKTRLQQDLPLTPQAATTTSGSRLTQAVSNVVQQRGVLGLWRGTSPTILRNVPGSALYFYFLHHLRSTFATSFSAVPRDTANLLSGALSRGFTGFLFMPMSVVKVRFESAQYAYTGIADAMRQIVAKEGVRGLFVGFGATAMRDVPHAGIYLAIYEQLKNSIGGVSTLSPTLVNMASGIMGGVLATVLTQPFDLVKTRVQIAPEVYHNSWAASVRIFQQEGVAGFFAGISPRLLRKPLHAAITWTIYEEVVRIANKWHAPSPP